MQRDTIDATFQRCMSASMDFDLYYVGFLAKLVMNRHQQIYHRTYRGSVKKLKVFIKNNRTVLEYSFCKLYLINII